MIGISKLYCGSVEPADRLRYGHTGDRKPVVVWNCTRACNLRCVHCYAHATAGCKTDEMSFQEGLALIDDLAAFGVPVLLFSGGEPLCRPELPELVAYAAAKGLRTVISTNGTLLTTPMAARLKAAGLAYAGISLDGMRETNDHFRGQPGAFDRALDGIRTCREAGLRVGLRYTMTRHNVADLGAVFDLLEREGVPRICFYHLVYAGRGEAMAADDLSADETRQALDLIIDRTADLHARGILTEVLTVDNHCDGPYLFMRLLREGRTADAEQALALLRRSGANSSGSGIACVSWDGEVYPDQFLRQHALGNVRHRPFSQIWSDGDNPLLKALRNKREQVTGQCVTCHFLDLCGGNFRARAEAATGDFWGVDPACYLTASERA
ncbi:MAG TPA: 12,18-didecarboxysiroheme deacetylase [Verrucomicrobia bacterium]|nr:12,18-didecarboxysiroheme deacetylase [Verrucomicrobiota bacterium]